MGERAVDDAELGGEGFGGAAVAGVKEIGELSDLGGVFRGPAAGVVGRRVLRDHERPVAGEGEQRLSGQLVEHRVTVGGTEVVHCGQQAIGDFRVVRHQIGDLLAVPYSPVLAGSPR